MYAVPPTHDTSMNTHSYSSFDFLDSLTPAPDDAQTSSITQDQPVSGEQTEEASEDVRSMKLTVINVVCMANMRCHLRLKDLARSGVNVEYKALQNVIFSLYFIVNVIVSRQWETGSQE